MDKDEFTEMGGPDVTAFDGKDDQQIIDVLEDKLPRYLHTIVSCIRQERYYETVRCMLELIGNLTNTASVISGVRLTEMEFDEIAKDIDADDSMPIYRGEPPRAEES